MSYFYSHIIRVDSLIEEINEMDMTDEQKAHLFALIDSTIHHTILDLVLEQLSPADKVEFLKMMEKNPRDHRIIDFLNTKVDKIEDQIIKTVVDLRKSLHEDIDESKRKVSTK